MWIGPSQIITQDNERRILKGWIRIEKGRIAEISETAPRSKKGKSPKVFSAKNLVLVPGFIQTHVHLCQTLFRNMADDMELLDWLKKRIWPYEGSLTENWMELSVNLGIHELLSSGTTAIQDMGSVRHTDVILESLEASGMRAVAGKCLMDKEDFCPPYLIEKTRDAFGEAVKLFETWNLKRSSKIKMALTPRFALSCTENLLSEIAAFSKANHSLIHTHASENQKETELVKRFTGKGNIQYLHHLGLVTPASTLAHCVWLNDADISLLSKSGAHVSHCPTSNLKLASGIARIPDMLHAGISVSLGCDGAPCNNTLNIFNEMKMAALIHKPASGPRTIRAQQALDMATREGAKALHWQEEIGSIEVGKSADLVALDLSQIENLSHESSEDSLLSSLVYSCTPMHVRWTMVEGKLLYHQGQVQGLGREKLLRQARIEMPKLLEKIRSLTQ